MSFPTPTPESPLTVFFDGDCPLCVREIRMLRRLDRRDALRFVDIAAPEFDPTEVGRTYESLMAQIHARSADGTWVTGADVFRALYAGVGFVTLAELSAVPLVRQAVDASYQVFAKNRLRLTGRKELCNRGMCAPQ